MTSPCGSTSPLGLCMRIFLHATLRLIRTSVSAITFLPASLHWYDATRWYRNINLSSIDYAFRPRLRVRLTLGGFTVPRKPWVCGEQDSHLLSRYLFLHNRFRGVQRSLPSSFTRLERSATIPEDQRPSGIQSFGCTLEPRSFSAQDLSTSELLRTL